MYGIEGMRAAPAPAPRGHDAPFAILWDERLRIVRLTISSVLTMRQIDEFLARLRIAIDAARTDAGIVRLLFDQRRATGQSAEVADRLWAAHAQWLAPRDRLAMVVSSSVSKTVLRHRFDGDGSKPFLSCEAAETWLAAWA